MHSVIDILGPVLVVDKDKPWLETGSQLIFKNESIELQLTSQCGNAEPKQTPAVPFPLQKLPAKQDYDRNTEYLHVHTALQNWTLRYTIVKIRVTVNFILQMRKLRL